MTTNFTTLQTKILHFLAENPDWHTRQSMYGYTGSKKGYAKAMGAPRFNNYPPDTLEGRGLVEHRGASRFEYRITPAGLDAIGRGGAGTQPAQAHPEAAHSVPEEPSDLLELDNTPAQRVLREIVARRGQQTFRAALLAGYGGRCLVTGCDAEAALEAAHIVPYSESAQNAPGNGLLLRADIHTLFDLELLSVHPDTLEVRLHTSLRETMYRDLHGKTLQFCPGYRLRPSEQALRERYAG